MNENPHQSEASLREQEEKLARTYTQILANPDRYHPVAVQWAKRHEDQGVS